MRALRQHTLRPLRAPCNQVIPWCIGPGRELLSRNTMVVPPHAGVTQLELGSCETPPALHKHSHRDQDTARNGSLKACRSNNLSRTRD